MLLPGWVGKDLAHHRSLPELPAAHADLILLQRRDLPLPEEEDPGHIAALRDSVSRLRDIQTQLFHNAAVGQLSVQKVEGALILRDRFRGLRQQGGQGFRLWQSNSSISYQAGRARGDLRPPVRGWDERTAAAVISP